MLAELRQLTALMLFNLLFTGGVACANELMNIEVFTSAEFPISGQEGLLAQEMAVTVYLIDGLDQFESTLSLNLSRDPETAEAEALQRIGRLDDAGVEGAKHAATGLVKAKHYDLDRYPAIVLNGVAVIYGVTDLQSAIQRFDAWHSGSAR